MSPLERLQLFIHGRLASEDYFAQIGLYLMRPRKKADGSVNSVPQITQKIEEALNGLVPKGGKAGAAVTVFMPLVTVPNADAQGAFQVTVVVRIAENPLVNMGASGTRESAESIGLEVIRSLNGWVPHGVSSQIYCDREALVFNEQVSGTSGKWVYDATVSTMLDIEEADRVIIPRIVVSGEAPDATVTITCGDPDAVIYYTINESFPSSANATAVLYEGPFVVAEPGSVFAAAYRDEMSGSHLVYAEVSGEEAAEAEGLLSEGGGILYSEDGSVLTVES